MFLVSKSPLTVKIVIYKMCIVWRSLSCRAAWKFWAFQQDLFIINNYLVRLFIRRYMWMWMGFLLLLGARGYPRGIQGYPSPPNRYTRLENLAWSHSVFWLFIFCRKLSFMKPLLLSSTDTLNLFNFFIYPIPPPKKFY